jgi:hypothetical protein
MAIEQPWLCKATFKIRIFHPCLRDKINSNTEDPSKEEKERMHGV